MQEHETFIRKAIDLACQNVERNEGGPFGAVIVKDGEIIAEGINQVTNRNDPTAHAEIMAIREACARIGSHQLEDCVIYSSCEPCPMCLGAIYWARPKALYFSASREDAADAGFDDSMIYGEFQRDQDDRRIKTIRIKTTQTLEPFRKWEISDIKKRY